MGLPGFILFLAGVTALGFMVSRSALAWGRGLPDAPLCLALAWPVGGTLVAGLIFGAWLAGWPPFTAGFAAGGAVALGAALLSRLGRRRRPTVSSPPSAPISAPYVRLALAMALLVFLWVQVGHFLAAPWGGGDSVAIWNLRAKALFHLPAPDWPQAFSKLMPNSHPDYPFGLSLLVAAGARAWGEFNPLVPAVVSGLFGASIIGLLAAGLRLLSGPVWLGLLIALAAPRFVVSTAHQCADVPLAACFLGAAVLVLLPGQRSGRGGWFLAGLLVGGAALIKNEGLVLAGLFVLLSVGWWLGWPELRRRAAAVLPLLVLGAALTLAAALAFKLTLAPPGDLTMHNSPALMVRHLLDPARWGLIAGWVLKEPFVLKHWLGWLLPVFLVAVWKGWRDLEAGGRLIPLVLLIVLAQEAAFIGVYLVTPRPLAWHLATSYHRLLFQLWPVLVLLACLPRGGVEAGVVDQSA